MTDPTGKQRKSVMDAAGRLASVYEPDPSNGNSLNLQTSYSYNVLDELTQVSQGSQTRSYGYDALGRLTSFATPETNGASTSFTYDSFDNVLTRTDPRGIRTTYTYDGLNRLTGRAYSNTSLMPNVCTTVPNNTPANVCYYYDQSNVSPYALGRMTSMADPSGNGTYYVYDPLGRVTSVSKGIGSASYTIGYAYNQANQLTSITYPSGRVVQQSVDPIGRVCEIAPSTTGCGTATSPFATGFTYNVANQVTGLRYGNGIYASFGFSNDRLQLTCLDYSTTNRNGTCTHDGTTKFGLTYSYGSAGSNNGRVSSIADAVDNGRSIAFSYDSLYRVTTAATTGSSNYPAWGLSETYDRYGNRTAQTVTQGTGPSSSISINAATNQITGSPYSYDASGNMTNDGVNTLAYDGEGRAVSASGSLGSGAYVYDGNGLRVEKCLPNCSSLSTSANYIFSGSKVIAEYDAWTPGIMPLTAEYVYSGGILLARVGSVDVRFTNDACCTGGDRNLYINSVTLGSTVINTNDPSVSYTVPSCNANGALYCDGDLVTVADAGRSATTITVNAWGSPNNNVYPHMQLLVGGVVVGEWDVTGTAQNYTATLPTTAAHYYHQDHLSNRFVTDGAGNTVTQMGHYPFGESWYNLASDKLYFTTYEWDAESGNHYAMARYHISRLGRLSSPDPIEGSTANPQSLNRYAYSTNDPANITDPTGALPGCYTVQARPEQSPQQSGHGGPSADDAGVEVSGGQDSSCYENLWDWLGGGVSLDGTDITDTSGGEGMGFPVGGGGMVIYTFTAGPNMDWGAYSTDQLFALADYGEIGLSVSSIPGAPQLPADSSSGGTGENPLWWLPPPKKPAPPCDLLNAAKYQPLVNFVNQNLPAAMTIASRVNTSVANILGLSSLESANGTGNIAHNYNNYFSLTVGSAFPGRVGTYTTPDGRKFGVYPDPGFLNSGLSFAGGFQGARVSGSATGSDFASSLTTPPLAFNSEPGYGDLLTNQIWTVQLALDCWRPK